MAIDFDALKELWDKTPAAPDDAEYPDDYWDEEPSCGDASDEMYGPEYDTDPRPADFDDSEF
jgi:hypothetical protein